MKNKYKICKRETSMAIHTISDYLLHTPECEDEKVLCKECRYKKLCDVIIALNKVNKKCGV